MGVQEEEPENWLSFVSEKLEKSSPINELG